MAFRHGVLGEKEEGSELTALYDNYSVAASSCQHGLSITESAAAAHVCREAR